MVQLSDLKANFNCFDENSEYQAQYELILLEIFKVMPKLIEENIPSKNAIQMQKAYFQNLKTIIDSLVKLQVKDIDLTEKILDNFESYQINKSEEFLISFDKYIRFQEIEGTE